jgi:hypothetical protein
MEKAWLLVAPAFPCLPQVTRGPGGFSVPPPRVNSCSFFSVSLHPSRGEGGVVRFGGGRSVWAAAWARDGDHTPLT